MILLGLVACKTEYGKERAHERIDHIGQDHGHDHELAIYGPGEGEKRGFLCCSCELHERKENVFSRAYSSFGIKPCFNGTRKSRTRRESGNDNNHGGFVHLFLCCPSHWLPITSDQPEGQTARLTLTVTARSNPSCTYLASF